MILLTLSNEQFVSLISFGCPSIDYSHFHLIRHFASHLFGCVAMSEALGPLLIAFLLSLCVVFCVSCGLCVCLCFGLCCVFIVVGASPKIFSQHSFVPFFTYV